MQQANAMEIAINEAKKMRDNLLEEQLIKKYTKHRQIKTDTINELIERLESLKDDHLPQEASVEATTWLSVESLLEEIPYMGYVKFVNMTTYWVAQTEYNTATGETPREALLALREKLISL